MRAKTNAHVVLYKWGNVPNFLFLAPLLLVAQNDLQIGIPSVCCGIQGPSIPLEGAFLLSVCFPATWGCLLSTHKAPTGADILHSLIPSFFIWTFTQAAGCPVIFYPLLYTVIAHPLHSPTLSPNTLFFFFFVQSLCGMARCYSYSDVNSASSGGLP